MVAHSTINVPLTMQQTLLSSNVEEWEKTIQFELESMEKKTHGISSIKAHNLKGCHDHCN
jgi:hypothetical protein